MSEPVTTCIYYADVTALNDPALFQAQFARVPVWRQEKIEALRFMKDRCLSLGAELLLQRALRDAGFDGVDTRFALGEHGKPFFAALPEFQFNLSHSGTKVLCAVSDRPIGCDVERIGDCNERLAKRFFHPDEYAALQKAAADEERAALFYRLWTLKESFLKVTGRGLSLPLSSFCISLCGDTVLLRQTEDEYRYGLYSLILFDGYACACCVRDDDGASQPELIEQSVTLS